LPEKDLTAGQPKIRQPDPAHNADVTDADDPDFWARQEHLDRIAGAIQSLSGTDPDFGLVAINARENVIRVFRRVRDVDRVVAESVYRELVPAGVAVEFLEACLSASEERAIVDSFLGFDGRLTSHGFRLQTVGVREFGGPVVASYLRAAEPLTVDLFERLGLTASWPVDAAERGAVVLHMLEQSTAGHWGELGRRSRG
jgi:hypothetical protein